MADNVSQKPPKPGENVKTVNVGNIIANETLRMGELDRVVTHPTCLTAGTVINQRKKAPSFQITSVSVGSNSRTSNDGGDDSADDLDESHTDDFSIDNSRITDVENETPSFSEDTFSKDELYFNPTNPSTTSVPVIPTSSQYGLAIVGSETENSASNANVINAAVVSVNNISIGDASVTETGSAINVITNTKSDLEMRDLPPHHASRNERFKVVKIESTEPFKRGRWMCMDYLDHTILQQQQTQLSGINVKQPDSDASVSTIHFISPESGVILTDNVQPRAQDELVDAAYSKSLMLDNPLVNQQNTLVLTAGQTRPIFPNISPGQSLLQDLQQIPVSSTQNSINNLPPLMNPQVNLSSQQVSSQSQQITNQPQQMSSQALPLGSQAQPINPQSQQINSLSQQISSQSQQVNPQSQQVGSQTQQMNPQQINQHLQQQYNSQQINPQSQQFNPQTQQNHVGLVGQTQQINSQTQQVNQQVTQQSQHFTSQNSHMNSQPQQFNPQPQQFNQQTTQQMHQGSGQQNMSQMQQNLQGQNFQTSSTQQVSQAQSMGQVPLQCATGMTSAQALQHQSLPPQQLQQVLNAVNMQQQMGVQQGLVQQQHLMQQVSHQGINQFQHQSAQYYGQSGIQMLPPQSGMPTANSIASVSLQHPPPPVQASATMSMPLPNTGAMTSQRQQQMTVQNQQQQMQQQMQLQQMASRQPQSLQQMPIQQQQQVPIQTQYSVQQQFPLQHQQQFPVQQQFSVQQQIPLVQLFPVQQQQQVPMQSQQVPIQQHQQQILQQNYQPIPNIQQSGQQILTRNVPIVDSQSASNLSQGHGVNQSGLIQGNQIPSGLHQNYVHQVPTSTQSETYYTSAAPRPDQQQVTGARSLSSVGAESTTGVQSASSVTLGAVSSSTPRSEVTDQSHEPLQSHAEGFVDVSSTGEDHAAPAEDPESASGTSAVAIDNKIEQAMDLVKSHLMFAVREEVEVLKEKIAELMERISQLEVENNLLRAHAPPEVVAQLPQPTGPGAPPPQQPQYPPNGNIS